MTDLDLRIDLDPEGDLPADVKPGAAEPLRRLRAINDESERLQAETADALAELNVARGKLVAELRDVYKIGVARQAELTGVHYTTLYRSLPKRAKAAS